MKAAAVVVAPDPDVDEVPFKIDIDAFGEKISGLLTVLADTVGLSVERELELLDADKSNDTF